MDKLLINRNIIHTNRKCKDEFSSLPNIPGLMIIKDENSRYEVISNEYAKLLGWKDADSCTDLTDYDIPCKAVEAADMFISLDQKTIQKKTALKSLYICQYANGWKTLLSQKIPIQDSQGFVRGVFGQVIDVSDVASYNWHLSLNWKNRPYSPDMNQPNIYILNSEHCPLPLSLREQTCLFLLVRGKTLKELASILGISPKTSERHIENIKNKLKCNNKSQLIEVAIRSGFIYYIPQEISRQMSSISF